MKTLVLHRPGSVSTDSGPDPVVQQDGPANPEDLLDRISGGCADSLSALHDAFAASLFGIAVRVTRNHAEAQEVLQDAFVAIWNKADQYNPALGKASTWLILLTRNLAIDRLRKRQRRDKMMERAAAQPESRPRPPSPISPLIAAETARRVREILRILPDDQRIALELTFYEGLTQTGISQHLQEPLGTVKSRIRRAMARVRSMIDGRPQPTSIHHVQPTMTGPPPTHRSPLPPSHRSSHPTA